MVKRLLAIAVLVVSGVLVTSVPAHAECLDEQLMQSGSWSLMRQTGLC